MDRRERWAEPVEALRAALDGRQAEMWTALPGIVQSFDSGGDDGFRTARRCRADLRRGGKGRFRGSAHPAGRAGGVPGRGRLCPHLPGGGGGRVPCGVRLPLHRRVVAVRRRRRADGAPDARPLGRLRPCRRAQPAAQAVPRRAHGEHAAPRRRRERLRRDHARRGGYGGGALSVTVRSGGSITLDAPRIVIKGLLSMQSQGGGATTATLAGLLNATGDVTASNISLNSHTHPGDSGGTTGGPQ